MQPSARRGLPTPGPGAWRCRDDSRARRGSRDSVLDSCRSPPPGRSGHCGHVEPAGPVAGPAGREWGCWGSPWGCSEPCWGYVSLPWAVGTAGSLGTCAFGRAGGRCPGLGVAPRTPQLPPQLGVGFRIGHVSWVSRAAPAVPSPGCGARRCPELQPGGRVVLSAWGARAAPPALGLPWIWAAPAAPPAPGAQPPLAPGSAAALAVSPVLGKGLGCYRIMQEALWTWAGTSGCRGR